MCEINRYNEVYEELEKLLFFFFNIEVIYMTPTPNIDKPKKADVERVKCNCCICAKHKPLYFVKFRTVSFIRAITPFKKKIINYNFNFEIYKVMLFNDSSSFDMKIFSFSRYE